MYNTHDLCSSGARKASAFKKSRALNNPLMGRKVKPVRCCKKSEISPSLVCAAMCAYEFKTSHPVMTPSNGKTYKNYLGFDAHASKHLARNYIVAACVLQHPLDITNL